MIGDNPSWIKAGLHYYDWNYLLIISTNDKKYLQISQDLKSELEQSTKLNLNKSLDKRLSKRIEILVIKNREILEFIINLKQKIRDIARKNYEVYFNATSGLQLWKFAMYFIYTEEKFITKFFYFPTDAPNYEELSPIEFYKPLNISESLKKTLLLFKFQENSLEDIMNKYDENNGKKVSKGLISRYLNRLKDLNLLKETKKKEKRQKIFEITEKGKWII